MSITKLKAFVLKTRIPYGDILKGVMEVKKLSKIFNFSIPPLNLYKYLIDDKNILSFNDVDSLYMDLIEKLNLKEKLKGITIKSVINKEESNLIDICLNNYAISCNILEYIYLYLLKNILYEFCFTDILSYETMEVIIDIPVSDIYNIYFNYESFSFNEKIDLFKEELAVWAMYNHIALLRKDDFEIVELEDEDILMVQFNISNRI
ncbi:unknown [Clostridium sp. CAG:465]|nr:unknown [Clostridium sp. CAG:465]